MFINNLKVIFYFFFPKRSLRYTYLLVLGHGFDLRIMFSRVGGLKSSFWVRLQNDSEFPINKKC